MEKNKICRLCLAFPQVSFSLLDKDIANVLEELTGIKINADDDLPKKACLKCWLNIKYAFRIQQSILESEKKLRSIIFVNEDEEIGDVNLDIPDPVVLEGLEDVLNSDDCNIKQELFDIPHKTELEYEELEYEMETTEEKEYKSIKVENCTEDEILVICQSNATPAEEIKEEIKPVHPTSCHICGSKIDENSLIEHLQTHYSTRLKCDECNTYCENITFYRKHILANHKELQQRWICKVCSASFQYKPLYQIHTENAHTSDKLPKIKLVHSSEKTFSLEEYKFDCPYCKRKFKSEERSLSHIKTHTRKECPICHMMITPSNLKVHVDSHNSQPVVCHLCGVTYKNQTSLRSHIYYTHSTRQYVCKYCKKVFKKSYDLPLHIKKEHTGQKDHICDICGKGFFTFHTLNTHKKMTHMKLRPWQCKYCKKKFSSKHSLVTHERQHTNVTPYACDVCGEGFRQNVSLRAHRKSKHNIIEEKTCACKVCGKKFGTEWAVLSHMRIH